MALPRTIDAQLVSITEQLRNGRFQPIGDVLNFLMDAALQDPDSENLATYARVLVAHFNRGSVSPGDITGCLGFLANLGSRSPKLQAIIATEIDREGLEFYEKTSNGGTAAPAKELAGLLDRGRTEPVRESTEFEGAVPPLEEHARETLSEWSARLASTDPKSFSIVVGDVIRRMRAIEEATDRFESHVCMYAGAAAQCLELVEAEVDGHLPERSAAPASRALELLLAELAVLGISFARPELTVIAQGCKMILVYYLARGRS